MRKQHIAGNPHRMPYDTVTWLRVTVITQCDVRHHLEITVLTFLFSICLLSPPKCWQKSLVLMQKVHALELNLSLIIIAILPLAH